MSNWTDFFKVKGEYAVRNLTVLISVIVGSIVVIYLALQGVLTSEIFGVYMFAGGGVYGFGKWQDEKTSRTEMLSAPDAPPITTTINQPTNVNVAGDVSPKKKAKR